jgi:hypothetical protein
MQFETLRRFHQDGQENDQKYADSTIQKQLDMKAFSFSSGRNLILSSIGSNPIVGAGRAGWTLTSWQRGEEETAPKSTGIRRTFFSFN